MTNVSIILLALFCAIGGYIIGFNRGNGFNKADYEEGYDDGWSDCVDTINANLDELNAEQEVKSSKKGEWDETREQKARELIEQLDDLFNEDDDDIIDGGEY